MVNIEDTIAASFDDLDFVVEALDKTTIVPFDKVIGNVVEMVIKRGQEGIETGQIAFLDLFSPISNFYNRFLFTQ